jgi:RNA polymerase sigma-70 factor (ECF subfamily)
VTPRVFQSLHQECYGRVLSGIRGYVGNQVDAEDVTATAFAIAFRSRKAFRGQAAFSTWVYRIAVNEAHGMLRRKRPVSLEALAGPPPEALRVRDVLDQTLDRSECCRRLRRALKRLPAIYRRVLVDHFVRGLSVKEVAASHRVPLGTTLSRIFTAKRKLRRAYATEV